jgi:SAM-dependent methyltransferase
MVLKDEVERRYRGEAGKVYHQTMHFVPDLSYPWVARLRADKIGPHVNRQDIVLEYGVGTGWNLAEIECETRLGFDLAESLESVVQGHGMQFIRDVTSISDRSIDVIICHHVLEHTSNPPEVLEEINRMLRHKGRLLLFVPYERERRYRRYDPKEPNHHLYSWNVQTLGNLVKDAGFKVVEGRIGRFGYDRFAAVWASRFCLGESGFRLVRRALHFVRPMFEVRVVAEKQ